MNDSPVTVRIRETISENHVVLFMKGTPQVPQCGFSAAVVKILSQFDAPFAAVNVLEDDTLREGIKSFSSWPTIPQLYVNGDFVGGCDIVREMHKSGELQDVLQARCLAPPMSKG